MVYNLFGTKPLCEPMLVYCTFDPWKQVVMKFKSRYNQFHTRKSSWKCLLQNGGRFVAVSMRCCSRFPEHDIPQNTAIVHIHHKSYCELKSDTPAHICYLRKRVVWCKLWVFWKQDNRVKTNAPGGASRCKWNYSQQRIMTYGQAITCYINIDFLSIEILMMKFESETQIWSRKMQMPNAFMIIINDHQIGPSSYCEDRYHILEISMNSWYFYCVRTVSYIRDFLIEH